MYSRIIGVSKKLAYRTNSSTIYAVYVVNKGLHSIDNIFHNARFGTTYYYYDISNNVRKIEVIDLLYMDPFIKTIGFDNFSIDDPLMTLPHSPNK